MKQSLDMQICVLLVKIVLGDMYRSKTVNFESVVCYSVEETNGFNNFFSIHIKLKAIVQAPFTFLDLFKLIMPTPKC